MAAARKVSHAASRAVLSCDWTKCASLARGGGFARAVDADDGNDGQTAGGFAQIGLIRRQSFFRFPRARWQENPSPRRPGFHRLF